MDKAEKLILEKGMVPDDRNDSYDFMYGGIYKYEERIIGGLLSNYHKAI